MKKSKDYSWLLYAMIIAIAFLASSCGSNPQTKYKGHVINSSVTRIVYDEAGYTVGDTILIQLGYTSPKFVIQSIIK